MPRENQQVEESPKQKTAGDSLGTNRVGQIPLWHITSCIYGQSATDDVSRKEAREVRRKEVRSQGTYVSYVLSPAHIGTHCAIRYVSFQSPAELVEISKTTVELQEEIVSGVVSAGVVF